MGALIVYESHWGNTRAVAEAIGTGLTAPTFDVDAAPVVLPADVDLLVVGAPTHALSLPTPASRAEAARAGGSGAAGLREWLMVTAIAPGVRVATFSTKQGESRWVGSAARSATRLLRKRGVTVVDTVDFVVTGREGPLDSGELERAQSWGRGLAEAK